MAETQQPIPLVRADDEFKKIPPWILTIDVLRSDLIETLLLRTSDSNSLVFVNWGRVQGEITKQA